MRVPLDVAEVVVLAVHGDPFPGRDAGEHPRPESHEDRRDRMELDRLVGEDAVQVDGGDQGSHLSESQPY